MSMFLDLLRRRPTEQDAVKERRAAVAAAALEAGRTAYLSRVVAILGSTAQQAAHPGSNTGLVSPAPDMVQDEAGQGLRAVDLIALAAIANDKPKEEPIGAWQYPAALAIVCITAAVLVYGSRTAPTTALAIVAETDHVAVTAAPEADAVALKFTNFPPIAALNARINGSAEALLLASDGGVAQRCPPIAIDRLVRLHEPEGLTLTFASGSTLTLSAFKTPGAANVDQLRLGGDGAWTLQAALPWMPNLSGDCSHFGGNEWRLPTRLTFQAPRQEQGDAEMLIQLKPGDRDRPPASALLPRVVLDASRVSFETVAANALLSPGPPARCSVIAGTVDFEQRLSLPLIDVRHVGHEVLGKRQCPTLATRNELRWRVAVEPIANGNFEVTQRASDTGGVGTVYLVGPVGERKIGVSYLAILTADPGLALLLGAATSVIANLWSLSQLLRRWIS